MPKKPKTIVLKTIQLGRRNPKWNYARFVDIDGKNARLEPCCLKTEPCWECK